jgi:hypothetical protein
MLLLVMVGLVGCGSSVQSTDQSGVGDNASPVANTVAHVQPQADDGNAAPLDKPNGNDADPETSESHSAETATFEPPFPHRTDLFQQPNPEKAAAVVRKREVERGGDLLLKGFVHVDRPRAMLAIDGKLWIAGEGDRRDDLRVMSIMPPNVSLSRDGAQIDLSLRNAD